jgi:hypothetical protein
MSLKKDLMSSKSEEEVTEDEGVNETNEPVTNNENEPATNNENEPVTDDELIKAELKKYKPYQLNIVAGEGDDVHIYNPSGVHIFTGSVAELNAIRKS